MKKIVLSALVAGLISSNLSARTIEEAGLDLGFGSYSSVVFNPYYEHLNDYYGLVYRADFIYQSFKEKYLDGDYKFTHYEVGGLFGKAFSMPISDKYDGGINALVGATYYNYSGKYDGMLVSTKKDFTGFNLRGGAKYSTFITKEIELGVTALLNIQFGDINCNYLTLGVEGAFHFTPNLYAHAKLVYEDMDIFDRSVVFTGIGYRF